MTRLSTTITRVAYPPITDREATWFILATSRGTCVGSMPWRPKEGDALTLEGEWGARNGEKQFKFKSAMIDIPTSPRDQLHYVVTRTVGLGPAMESIIWDFAKDKWKDIKPDTLPKLKGKVYEEFRNQIAALEQDADKVAAIAFLMGKSCTQNMACAAWEKWEKETLGVVTANPYQLAELPNYGFAHVDGDVRRAFGIGDQDERRIKAAVVYSLRQLTGSGSTVIEWREVLTKCMGYVGGQKGLINKATRELVEDGTLYWFGGSKSVALMRDWRDEMSIWEFVNKTEREA
jgi:hypothetical protein